MSETNSQEIRQSIIRSVAFNFVGKIATLIVGILLTPFILHRLGTSQYGLWMLVASVAAYGNLLDLGISSAVIKYVAEHASRGEYAAARSMIATALRVYVVVAAVGVILSAAIALAFPHIFSVSSADRATAGWLMFVIGSTVSVALPCTTASSVLRALQRFDIINLINTSYALVSAAATILVLLLGGTVLALALMNLALMLLMQAPAIAVIRRAAPFIDFGWRGADRRMVGSIFTFSSAVLLVQVAGRLQTKSDEVLLGIVSGLSVVTPYSLGRRLSELPQILSDQFLKVLLPVASGLHATRNIDTMRELFISSTRVTLAIFVPVGCVITFLSTNIISIWVGPQYASASAVAVVLTAASAFNTATWPAGTVLQSMSRHRPLAISALLSGVGNMLLSVALLPHLGMVGVAVGTLVPTVIESLCFIFPYTLRLTGVSLRRMGKEALLPLLLPSANMAAVLWFLNTVYKPRSLFDIALLVGAGALVYTATYWITGRATPERRFFATVALANIRFAESFLRSL